MITLMPRYKKALILLMMLLLGACQTAPKNVDDGLEIFNPDFFAAQYQQRSDNHSWSLKGVFSFANAVENANGKVFWDQADGDTKIQLFGPLGVGSVTLDVRPGIASMQQGKKKYSAPNSDELMLKVLGWKMPLESLNYWLYGLAAPDQKARYRSGEKGEIVELSQSGWVIRFKQYRQVDGFSLLMPRKIFATHAETETDVRLVVKTLLR